MCYSDETILFFWDDTKSITSISNFLKAVQCGRLSTLPQIVSYQQLFDLSMYLWAVKG